MLFVLDSSRIEHNKAKLSVEQLLKHWWIKDLSAVSGVSAAASELSQSRSQDQVSAISENLTCVVLLPNSRHNEPAALKAKAKELADYQLFKVWSVVDTPADANVLSTKWVMTETGNSDNPVKARLCIMGNMEENLDKIPAESPTVSKAGIRLCLTEYARRKEWKLTLADARRAFLQSSHPGREIYVKPPKEMQLPSSKSMVLNVTSYGCKDAALRFFQRHANELTELDCEMVQHDPALFLHHGDQSKLGDEERDLDGMYALHIDDGACLGDEEFMTEVLGGLQQKMVFGQNRHLPAMYVGLNMKKIEGGISIDQDQYVAEHLVQLGGTELASYKADELLSAHLQDKFRSMVAKAQQVSITTRPDLSWQIKTFIKRYGYCTKADMLKLNKVIAAMAGQSTTMVFRDLGPMEEWVMLAWSDGSLKKEPDQSASTGGSFICLANSRTQNCCPLLWRSRQLDQVCHSSLGCETKSLKKLIGEINLLKMTLSAMHGQRAMKIPTIVLIDCGDLKATLTNLKPASDKMLLEDFVSLRAVVAQQELVHEVRKVSGEFNLADVLTKPTANSDKMRCLLTTGSVKGLVSGGLVVQPTPGLLQKQWVSLPSPPKDPSWAVGSQFITLEQPEQGGIM